MHHLGAGLMYLMYEFFSTIKSQDLVRSLCLPMNVLDFDFKGFVDPHGFEVEML